MRNAFDVVPAKAGTHTPCSIDVVAVAGQLFPSSSPQQAIMGPAFAGTTWERPQRKTPPKRGLYFARRRRSPPGAANAAARPPVTAAAHGRAHIAAHRAAEAGRAASESGAAALRNADHVRAGGRRSHRHGADSAEAGSRDCEECCCEQGFHYWCPSYRLRCVLCSGRGMAVKRKRFAGTGRRRTIFFRILTQDEPNFAQPRQIRRR